MNLLSTLQFHHYRLPWMALGLILLLTACVPIAGPAGDSPAPTTVAEEAATDPITETTGVTDTAPITTTDAPTESTTLMDLSTLEQQLVERAIEVVATETGVAAADITLVNLQAMEWPDSSLGCPQPETMYIQVITPGYQLTLKDANGTAYDIHTGFDPSSQVILCKDAEGAMSNELTATDEAQSSGILTGTVLYLQRVALPPGAVIDVQLQDVSKMDVAATLIAQQTIVTEGENVPIGFELTYDPAQIDPRFTYALSASITIEGQLRWINTERYAVLTNGAPLSGVEVRVQPVQ